MSATLISKLDGTREEVSQAFTCVTLSNVFYTAALCALGISLQASHGLFDEKSLALILVSIGFCCLGLGGPRAVFVLPMGKQILARYIFLGAIVVYLLVSLAFLHQRHTPIDAVIFQVDSVQSLIHAENPYGAAVTHPDIYYSRPGVYPGELYGPGLSVDGRVHVGFPYPPLTLLWIMPGYFMGDIRYSYLLAVLLAAVLIFQLAPDVNGLIAAVLLLFAPATQHVLTMGWTDPLAVLCLVLTIYCTKRAPTLLPVALGLFFASKQYSFLALPIAGLLLPKFSWKSYVWLLARAGAVAGMIAIPFLYWDPRGFWRSLVTFHLQSPFRLDSLSLSALLVRHGFPMIPQWGVLLGVAAGTGFALLKAPRTAAGFAASLALISLIFFVFNKQAFCNYYFFCAGALCLSLAASEYKSSDHLFAVVELSQDVVANAA
jgi:hypothetical protein